MQCWSVNEVREGVLLGPLLVFKAAKKPSKNINYVIPDSPKYKRPRIESGVTIYFLVVGFLAAGFLVAAFLVVAFLAVALPVP